jgi:hypothetical protein
MQTLISMVMLFTAEAETRMVHLVGPMQGIMQSFCEVMQ